MWGQQLKLCLADKEVEQLKRIHIRKDIKLFTEDVTCVLTKYW